MKHKPVILLLFLVISYSSADIIRVPGDFPSIQSGINSAVNGDTVLISDSTYYENIDFKGKAITVASYFYMDGDTNHINNTIIDGGQPGDSNKGSVVRFTSSEDTTSVICGLTITGGSGTLYDSNRRVGGGIYCENSGARISHNKIVNNSVIHDHLCLGGGIGCRSDQISKYVIIEDNIIESNSLYAQNGSSGGGIFLHMQGGSILRNIIRTNYNSGGNSSIGFGGGIATYDNIMGRYLIKIVGNSIIYNEATSTSPEYGGIGGGIDIQLSDVLLLSNQIIHNVVSGAKPGGGAGARLIYASGNSIVKNNTISFNSSHSPDSILWSGGGGFCTYGTVGLKIQENHFEGNESAAGGGLANYSTQGTVITENSFINNHCYIGGGVYEEQTVSNVINGNRFTGNSADYYGGGIMITECSPDVHNNIITHNKATFNGGGIYIGDQNSESYIINNTLVADTAGLYGGGICTNGVSPVIMNSILWDNVAPDGSQLYTIAGNTEVGYCDIQGGFSGTGNIDDDPQFINANYHISETSPCVDKGNPDTDYNDPEDPDNPGLGQYPAKGTTRNDMGAFGGPGASDIPTAITYDHPAQANQPTGFTLFQNFPNPFNPSTTIEFRIPDSEIVTLKIFNLLGQEVVTLINTERLMPGNHKYEWRAQGTASGVYFYRINAGRFTQMRKMLLIR